MLATAHTGKTWERFWEKMQVNAPLEISKKKSLAVGAACMAILYRPAPGLKGGIFELCVLNSYVFNCCICSNPLWGDVKVILLICDGPTLLMATFRGLRACMHPENPDPSFQHPSDPDQRAYMCAFGSVPYAEAPDKLTGHMWASEG